ncbi:MAG: alpha/beta hydrolase [Nitratireductor sp.]|nr:alpha/beta hydrolase [Nitratireductor sp.]
MNSDVAKVIDAFSARLISDGIPFPDLALLKARIADTDRWCEGWVNLSREYEERAQASLEGGASLTAALHLWRAALCCHFGQGILMDISMELKAETDARKRALFQRAAGLFPVPLREVSIDFDGVSLPGYLRLPPGQGPFACVVLFGGLDTTKEDAYELTSYFAERGLATLTFDGPGQGAVFYEMPLRMDFEAAVSAAIDSLAQHAEIDLDRIGVLGRSTGGHWACKAAALDPRIKVAISWGLIFDLRHFADLPDSYQKRFMRAANIGKVEEAIAFFAGYDLDGIPEKLNCPYLIVQGGLDDLAPPDGVERVLQAARSPVETMIFAQSGHCAHDRAHLAKPAMADFASRHLLSL